MTNQPLLPGFLRSTKPLCIIERKEISCKDTAQFQLDTLADDIELIRKKLGFDQVIVMGHSGHAYMALEYAKRYPAHVSHLVMLCAGPNLSKDGMTECKFIGNFNV